MKRERGYGSACRAILRCWLAVFGHGDVVGPAVDGLGLAVGEGAGDDVAGDGLTVGVELGPGEDEVAAGEGRRER